MAGTADDSAARARRRSKMRASHADREQIIDKLKAAYVYGLVTKDEFDERVGETLASRTRAELALIVADFPAGLAAAPPTLSPASASPDAPASAAPIDRAIFATAVLSGLAIIAAFFGTNPGAGLLVLVAVGSGLFATFLLVRRSRGARRDQRPGGQPPPQGAINTGRSAGQLPQSSQQRRPSTADAARSHSLRPRWST